jgi:predicted permease
MLGRRDADTDLDDELRAHIELATQENRLRGMSEGDARREALRSFGGVTQTRERFREQEGLLWLESLRRDVAYALRQMRKSPGFAATAVATLALGIAVNTTMFSMVSAFLIPKMPGKQAEKVVVISSVDPDESFTPAAHAVSPPNYLAYRADTRVFAALAAADDGRTGSLAGQGQPEGIEYAAVTPNYFDVFQAPPALGRTFEPGEDQAGRDHVTILSYGLWKRRFNADPAIVGRTLRLNREDYTVVGVMPADFLLMGFTPQLWTPLTLSAADAAPAARQNRYLFLFARLAPGVTLDQARAEMRVYAQRAAQDFPDLEKRWEVGVRTLPDYLVYSFGIRNALAIIMTMVFFILLIACANVAGLLLTRGMARQKEIAIRVSLGAGRARIVRQLLTEGAAIALAGGVAGLMLADLGIRWLRAKLSFNDAISAVPLSLDRNVLWFAICIALLSAVLSSLAPALRASRADVQTGLKHESRTASSGRSVSRMRALMVGGEFMLALFLLTGSTLIIRGIYALEHQKLGFRRDHLLTAGIALDKARYSDAAQQMQFVRELLPRLRQIPGVRDVAAASVLPATGGDDVIVRLGGEPALPNQAQKSALDAVVSPEYFEAATVPLLRGRTLTDGDDAHAPRAAVVNREFVHRYLGDGDALGRQIEIEFGDRSPVRDTIVGVVSDVKRHSEETRVDPEIYEAYSQRPLPEFSLMLRTGVDPNNMIPEMRRAVAQSDPELPLLRAMSMENVIEGQRNGDPLFTRLLATFALLALLLAAIGIYGLVAYAVGQRTHEIGIRLALGAKGQDVAWMILREGALIAAIGSAIGLTLALPLPKLFDSIFVGISFASPPVYPVALAAMLAVAAVATCGPAVRAAHVDPTRALRSE